MRKSIEVKCPRCRQIWMEYPGNNIEGKNALCEQCFKYYDELLYENWIAGNVIVRISPKEELSDPCSQCGFKEFCEPVYFCPKCRKMMEKTDDADYWCSKCDEYWDLDHKNCKELSR